MQVSRPPRTDILRSVWVVMSGIALVIAGWLLLGLLAPALVLPGGLRPPLGEVFYAPPSPVYPLGPSDASLAGDHARLHIEVMGLDDAKQLITLRVSGRRACAPSCTAQELVLVSLRADEADRGGLPPFATVSLPAHEALVQDTIDLPVQEHVMQYPFDVVDLLLGVALQQAATDDIAQPVPATEAAHHLQLTFQEAGISQLHLSTPRPMDPATFASASVPFDYVTVEQLSIGRANTIKTLTALLVTLIAGTALYSVTMRSMHDVVLGFGGLILGVWSVRAILVPSPFTQRTGVDAVLAGVIVFILVVFITRAARIIAPNRGRRHPPSAGTADSAAAYGRRRRV
ncbi:MAG: hypothetical protein JO023_16230 [Chloroflexi bacterium]|nr:hypothetical protein [Chloroflexota bacterium]